MKFTKYAAIAAASSLVLVGGAGAATQYLITSTHQIKPSVLRQLHGARGARGPAGRVGATGATGATGAAGGFSASSVTQVTGPTAFLPAGSVASSVAQCPAGSVALGGGWTGLNDPPVIATTAYNQALGSSSWEVIMADNTGSMSSTFAATVVCGGGAGASAARAGLTSAQRATVARQIAALKARRR